MSATEVRAGLSLGSLFALRMLGLFVILPVFAVHAPQLAGGDNLTLVGVALGAYGLTQAILQIPFGMAADRFGRKRVILFGLLLFAAGSFVAAGAQDIWVTIAGRVIQGAGAISAAVMALAGPAANLLLVVLAGGLVRLGVATGAYRVPEFVTFTAVTQPAGGGLAAAAVLPLSIFFTLNLVLFVFNLLPLPPLDGSAAIAILMPDEMARRYQEFLHNPSFSFLGILIAWRLFNPVFDPVHTVALRLLYLGAV